ncbi:leucyl aminopeptidase [Loktanella fryxellensis]|uniref:Leucyl aminopeptidase n=1 Tax=Loktanella fryxellensis TaxID=245187 RepID=A0A1H8FJW2_9RHOB|nr:leucyl aminopeptidase family protein [Loktanella fryxellensis]SEN31916.1 leucyl aminopeptidase [Loktanella fryxellensis]
MTRQTPPSPHIATFAAADSAAIPLHVIDADDLAAIPAGARSWAAACGFTAAAGTTLVVPGEGGGIAMALVGQGSAAQRRRSRFVVAPAARRLPPGTYAIASGLTGPAQAETALGWLMESYDFARYGAPRPAAARLVAPNDVGAARLQAIADGEALTRDLINTPTNDMGPADLADAAQALAQAHGADCTVTVGDDLIAANFPLIHAVGRASASAPRLIEMNWGHTGPHLTLVGKGVCFDTGGLNIKPGSSMGLMKKDMGGAATVLGLAQMIMALNLPLRLRVLIPAVENSISADAFRPQDILTSRKGLTVEINNTDAEGRLVLADALALACEGDTDLVISMATLTGAARVALGPDIAPFFTDDDGHAAALTAAAARVADPVWRLPFHDPYEEMIEPGIADLDNAPGGGMAGAITAALFLRRFTDKPYIHFDIYGWTPISKPARPKGGAGIGARAILDALPDLLGLSR